MLHPSYTDLMNAVNSGNENSEEPTINSRYSIVIAASRRARQIIDEREAKGVNTCVKPLSVAVDELNNGEVRIVSEDDLAEEDIDLNRDFLADMNIEEDAEADTEEVAVAEDASDETDVLEENIEEETEEAKEDME